MEDFLIKTKGISKEFSGVRVLNNIDFELKKGEILGLIGENGAGKSTLMKIISGLYFPTEGEIFFEGEKVVINSPFVAKKLGISIIPQEFNLINHLNVYENIFLGNEKRKNKIVLDKKAMRKKTKELMNKLKTVIDPDTVIEGLSVAQKQMVEIAKALSRDSKLLILDEPTTVLTINEIEILFDLMRNLKDHGVSMVYISHKLGEVKEICDEVMILRDGNFVSKANTSKISEKEMAENMVGRVLSEVYPEKVSPDSDLCLEVKDYSVDRVLHNISFDLKKGEILGFAGLVGAGRTELAETIIGIRKKKSGELLINGEKVEIKNPLDAVNNGIGYLPEDRQGTGIITNFDLIKNTTLVSLRNYGKFIINKKKERERTREYVDEFKIRAASLKTKLEFFSGGNQQKVSLAKCLDPQPKIIIFDEPTRGIDVNAKREIYFFINDLVKKGISCIFISSELEEIIGMCNRVAVMKEGSLAGILEGEHINEKEIMYYATGVKGAA
ncbi:MAG: ribose transport system ATP-binding protein [Kosmotogales bacterium]|nr:ribose transport system ATP-binding protein [Kosmotogales bacterium]